MGYTTGTVLHNREDRLDYPRDDYDTPTTAAPRPDRQNSGDETSEEEVQESPTEGES